MSARVIDLAGRKVALAEQGIGAPILYLHGFADVHALTEGLLPFHHRLAARGQVLAPAHPGCAGSDELGAAHGIEDVLFHYLELIDALGLDRFALVGHSVGGWIAAELAVRHPERVTKLALIDACGLFVAGAPIGDVFMHAQPERGTDSSSLRNLLFTDAAAPMGLRHFPDGRGDIDEAVRRYQMLRFGSFVGFRPPYFYSRPLRDRLRRAAMPALVVWGEHDRMVPRSHGQAFADGLKGSAELQIVAGAGHSTVLERPDETAELVTRFL
jgi:pimeloyl-ACP methyl ester carboxylesterase